MIHVSVSTEVFQMLLKVEEDCKLGSVDEIAAAVYQMLNRIQQEWMLN